MNANELADYVDKREINNPHLKEAATMLREQQRTIDGDKRLIGLLYQKIAQQQAEIEALKGQLDTRTRELIGASFYEHDYKTMMANNEPVALTQKEVMDALTLGIPLYTHPVNPKYDPENGEPLIDGYPLFSGLPHPVKELTMTDDEVMDLWNEQSSHPIDFARAILRKAQEK